MGAAAGAAQVGIGGLQILQGRNEAKALKRQADFQAQQMEFNAKLLDYEKSEINKAAQQDIDIRNEQVNQMLGAQKVSLAAQGIDVEGDLGQTFEQQERKTAADDIQSIKNNAWRKSMGLEIKQFELRSEAQATRISGKAAATSALNQAILSGTGSALSGLSKMGIKPSYSNKDYTYKSGGRSIAYNYKSGSSRGLA